jgi:hypothetical protein
MVCDKGQGGEICWLTFMLLLAGIFKHHHAFVPSRTYHCTVVSVLKICHKISAHPESNHLGVKKCLKKFLKVSSLQHVGKVCLKSDDTRAETRFRLSAKRTSPFKSAGASVQSTAGSRGVRISGSNAGYTSFRGSVKSTGYPLRSPVSPSLTLPCVTVCRHISTGVCCSNNSGD